MNFMFSERNQRCTNEHLHQTPTKDNSITYGHQSNALQILYGMDLSNKVAIVTGANTGIGRRSI